MEIASYSLDTPGGRKHSAIRVLKMNMREGTSKFLKLFGASTPVAGYLYQLSKFGELPMQAWIEFNPVKDDPNIVKIVAKQARYGDKNLSVTMSITLIAKITNLDELAIKQVTGKDLQEELF